MKKIEYDPCPVCEYRQKNNRCAFAKKPHCPSYAFKLYLDAEGSCIGNTKVPTEIFVEILRAKGLHGELKQTKVVSI